MNPFEMLDPYIDQLTTLRGPTAIVIFLIMFGYMMKMLPDRWLPNRWIPFVNCFVLGPALSVLLLGWPTNGEIPPEVRFPDLAAWAQAYQKGFCLSCLAWLGYGLVIGPITEKLKQAKPAPIPPAAEPQGV
jgi:hypothetical protein